MKLIIILISTLFLSPQFVSAGGGYTTKKEIEFIFKKFSLVLELLKKNALAAKLPQAVDKINSALYFLESNGYYHTNTPVDLLRVTGGLQRTLGEIEHLLPLKHQYSLSWGKNLKSLFAISYYKLPDMISSYEAGINASASTTSIKNHMRFTTEIGQLTRKSAGLEAIISEQAAEMTTLRQTIHDQATLDKALAETQSRQIDDLTKIMDQQKENHKAELQTQQENNAKLRIRERNQAVKSSNKRVVKVSIGAVATGVALTLGGQYLINKYQTVDPAPAKVLPIGAK